MYLYCGHFYSCFLSIDPNAPSVVVAPEDVLALAGDTVQFHCSFDGDPQPTAGWYYKMNEDSTPQGPLTDGQG